jgi:hypothetical protein
MIMFGLGWGFTEFLASALQEYRTAAHRPDGAWTPEQTVAMPIPHYPRYLERPNPRPRNTFSPAMAGDTTFAE